LPDVLKINLPQTLWGRILAATPVTMTVIATALAGLASSEMTRAQYARSLAAQQQSKAGDQWGFFQAKRLRGTLQRNTIDLLRATGELRPLDAAALAGADAATVAALVQGQLPDAGPAPALDPDLVAALHALERGEDVPKVFHQITDQTLARALRSAQARARAFDETLTPISRSVAQLEEKQASREFIAARLRYTAARYDAEAKLNQAIAQFYELQVRRSNFVAERHHRRSQRFFYGMLAAQAAVIIATFSLAAQKRGWLWSLAAAAGAAAVAFAAYVYLFV
jgi:hypothetical protein